MICKEEETGMILYTKIFVFVVLLVAAIYFERWWLWAVLILNTISDWLIIPMRKRRRNKMKPCKNCGIDVDGEFCGAECKVIYENNMKDEKDKS